MQKVTMVYYVISPSVYIIDGDIKLIISIKDF